MSNDLSLHVQLVLAEGVEYSNTLLVTSNVIKGREKYGYYDMIHVTYMYNLYIVYRSISFMLVCTPILHSLLRNVRADIYPAIPFYHSNAV